MQKPFQNKYLINDNLPKKSSVKFLVLLLAVLFVLVLGIADYLSGYDISFSIFYLIPISLSVFYCQFKLSLLISVLSALSWYCADIYSGHIYVNLLIPFWNSIMRLGYFILHSFLLAKFFELYQKTKQDSLTDSLTGLLNSRYFYALFAREFKKANRSQHPFTLAYLDLDNFKSMNDTFGHPAGDLLLKQLAHWITEHTRPSDLCARLGGDEFALLFPESDFHESNSILKRIKSNIDSELKKNSWPVSLSIGAITFKVFTQSLEEMLKQTDDLMYTVKKNGKDNIVHHLKEPIQTKSI